MGSFGKIFVVAFFGFVVAVDAAGPQGSLRGSGVDQIPAIEQLSPFIPDLSLIMGKDLQDFSNTELPRLKDLLAGWIPTGGLLDGLATAISTSQGSILGSRETADDELRSACDKLTEISTQCFLKEVARHVGETWGTGEIDAEEVGGIADRMDTFGLLPASAKLVCRHSPQILPLISYRQKISTELDVKNIVNKSIEACQ